MVDWSKLVRERLDMAESAPGFEDRVVAELADHL